MTGTLLALVALSTGALVAAWVSQRRFLRSLQEEIRFFTAVVERWADSERRRQEHMRESAAQLEHVVARLLDLAGRTDAVARDVQSDVENLVGPVAQLVRKHEELAGALPTIEHQFGDIVSALHRLGPAVPAADIAPTGSVEELVLDMIRQQGAPRTRS